MEEKPKRQARFGGPIRVIVLTIAVFIISQVIAGLIVGFALRLRGINTMSYDLNSAPLAQFFYILIAEALTIGLVLYVLRRQRLKPAAIGLGRRPKWGDIARALAGFIVFYGLVILATAIISLFVPDITNQQQQVGFNNLHTKTDYLLALAALVILPPLGEETLVRGYLYSGLRSRWRFVPALLVTSVLFGLAHLQSNGSGLMWAASVDTFILSVVLVYLRESTGALYAGMLVHMLNNLIAFGVHFHF